VKHREANVDFFFIFFYKKSHIREANTRGSKRNSLANEGTIGKKDLVGAQLALVTRGAGIDNLHVHRNVDVKRPAHLDRHTARGEGLGLECVLDDLKHTKAIGVVRVEQLLGDRGVAEQVSNNTGRRTGSPAVGGSVKDDIDVGNVSGVSSGGRDKVKDALDVNGLHSDLATDTLILGGALAQTSQDGTSDQACGNNLGINRLREHPW